jgi:2-keto-4-pentenoate hydratase/2-oxohepta-3-ene-1,7-dioic acid hydratase in catechol pathway
MSFARLGPAGSEIPVFRADGVAYDLRSLTLDIDGAFLSSAGILAARAAHSAGSLPVIDETGMRIGAPIARPGKIVCIGLNYSDHAEESGLAIPTEPVVFMKDPSTLVGPYDDVLIPRRSNKTDWEVELGVVIGREARYLDSPADAASVIAGYAVSHDVSEREFQLERSGQWDLGKSCETFNPFGPELVPADEIVDPQALGLRLWVNGTPRQNGTTATMIFPIDYLIWYLSQYMVLRPGDVVNTGTPAGVALGMPDKPYLRPGDVVELEIDGLGRAKQTVAQA